MNAELESGLVSVLLCTIRKSGGTKRNERSELNITIITTTTTTT